MFQPIKRYFKKIGDTEHIPAWKSNNGLSDESNKLPATSDNSHAPGLSYVSNKILEKMKC